MAWFRCMGGSGGGTSGTVSGEIATFSIPNAIKSVIADITAWQEGTGTASPSNPRAISGWSSVKVMRAGKNLIGTLAKTGVTINTSGEEVSNVNFDCSDYLYFKAGTYSVSCEDYIDSTTSSAKLRIGAYSLDNKTFISPLKVNISATATIGDITTASFTLATDCYIKVAFNKSRCKNLQIEIGSTATAYEPYAGDEVTITLGQTVYGGRLNVTTGELTITHGYYKVTGSETITRASLSSDNIVFKVETGVPNVDNNENQISNIGTYNSSATIASDIRLNNFVIDANGDLYVQFARSDFTNVGAFTTWLESNSVEVSFELATPTTVQLTATEIKALSGINNVWADSGDIEVEYSTISEGGGGAEYLMDNLVANTYISKENGVELPFNNWSSTPYIPVTAGETIKMALYNSDNWAAWYQGSTEEEATFLSNFRPSNQGYSEVTVPTGATFFRYSNTDDYMAKTMIWRDIQ